VFYANLADVYGVDLADRVVDQLGCASQRSFWINPLRPECAPHLPDFAQAVVGLAGVWCVPRGSGLTMTAAAERGGIYIQNPSSVFAARVLAPQPHEEILDLAAAPGGKTLAMASMMGNTGRIAAVEPVPGRFHPLRANVARCGATNVDFYRRDGRGVGRAVGERFDGVLLDAPCSSESRMRWYDPRTYRHWSARKVRETQRKQKRLLQSAYAALKPGGRLVYCTCSFSIHENEAVVAYLLEHTDARIEPIEHALNNTLPGVTLAGGAQSMQALAATLRIVPDAVWDGFYIAQLSKPGGR